ncbi:MAG: hypothetical protein ACREAA_08660 [Candidatus Polarisedimenticolia bacterium]
MAIISCVLGSFSTSATLALHRRALEQIAASYTGRAVVLRVNLHAPIPNGEEMSAPMLNAKGWHNASGLSVLSAGSTAEVTGVFNYAERGFFLEIAADPQRGAAAIIERPRVRVRLMIEAPANDPAAQSAEAIRLIGTILTPADSGTP